MNTPIKRLGLLALGETPRPCPAAVFRAVLGPGVEILERGALDGLEPGRRDSLLAGPGEVPLETHLRSGTAVGISRALILPRLLAAADDLARVCDRVLLMCSGEFPLLAEACPGVIQPIWILRGAVGAAARDRKLGLIGPAEDLPEAPAQWRPYVPDVICAAASPSDPLAAAQAAGRDLAARGARLVYLDCMGFTEEHRAAVRDAAGLPVLCATTLTARALAEML
jgi:protein AroM